MQGRRACPSLWRVFVLWCVPLQHLHSTLGSILDLCHLFISGPRPSGHDPSVQVPTCVWKPRNDIVRPAARLYWLFFFCTNPCRNYSGCGLAIFKIRSWSRDSATQHWGLKKNVIATITHQFGFFFLTQASLLLCSHLGSTDMQNILRTPPRWRIKSTLPFSKAHGNGNAWLSGTDAPCRHIRRSFSKTQHQKKVDPRWISPLALC